MHPNSVFAAAASRLHADLIVIRLRRAGIARDRISAVFPENLRPNSAECWLEGSTKPVVFRGEPVMVAGPLHKKLELASDSALHASLKTIGLGTADASALAERIGKGKILIAIDTQQETEVAIAWHTLRELEAEGIALAVTEDVATRPQTNANRARNWTSRKGSSAPVAIPLAMAAAS